MSLPKDVEGVRVLAETLAREHAAGGGKVVGYLTPCVPAEMIAAAGMWPIMLGAGGETSTALGDHYMEDLFDTSLRGVFERLLKGELDFLSAIVLPRANDSAHRLYYYLSELKRTGGVKLPPVLLCDVVMTPDEASRKYSLDALGRLWGELRALGNPRADDAELMNEILKSNERMSALMSMVHLNRRQLGMAGAQALATFAAVRMLPDDVAQQMIRADVSAAELGQRRPRIIICGSAQDDAGLHRLVEAAGGIVVGDYHAGGELSVGPLVELFEPRAPLKRVATPLLELLVERHRNDQAASRRLADAGHLRRFATDCEADAAIFSYFAEEEALTWDYPEQKATLEKGGVRVLRLMEQTRPYDVEANRAAVEAFLRGSDA